VLERTVKASGAAARTDGFLNIDDYGALGDGRSVALQLDWYHWFMATKRGAVAIAEFTRLHWQNWALMDSSTR
jgi:hypothetical protein